MFKFQNHILDGHAEVEKLFINHVINGLVRSSGCILCGPWFRKATMNVYGKLF